MNAVHCGGCAKNGRWRRCVACRRPACVACSSPESGTHRFGGKQVPWRCLVCNKREVQTLDFDGEPALLRMRRLVREGLSLDSILSRESTDAIARALYFLLRSELALPDIIGAVNPDHDKEMRWLAAFAGADSIEFREVRDGLDETYVLKKRGRALVLHVKGGRGEAKLRVEDPGPV